jgi:uncharacterized protein YabN with tetrapyrrole methylase and pyrophosphatase domain
MQAARSRTPTKQKSPPRRRATTGARRGSLVVVGTGMRLVGQTTLEALDCLRRAEKLFYLSSDPATAAWIGQLNSTAQSLEDCYTDGKSRYRIYMDMATRIMDAVQSGLDVCAAFYGHPGVFVSASHEAIRRARRRGYPARMLPGISAEACLVADLGMDPAENGCQSFEATDFLASRRRFDPSSALILWQVGVLGESRVKKEIPSHPERLRVLESNLRRHYPASHRVVLYEAAQYPLCDPVIKRVALSRLSQQTILPRTTIYVPPKPGRRLDPRIMKWLNDSR